MASTTKKHLKFHVSWPAMIVVLGLISGLFLLTNGEYLSSRISLILNPSQGNQTSAARLYPPNTIAIESLNLTAPLVYTEGTTETAFQKALAHGVVHHPASADIGELGNAYFFGHSSDVPWSQGDYKTVFATLPDIKKGAAIVMTDDEGNAYTYIVTETKVVRPTDLSVLSQETDGKRVLTLQTSYPLGTALRRYIVVAELVTQAP